jgi:hypothetical protein
MPSSPYGRPQKVTGQSASDESAPYVDDPEWLASAYRQGVNPKTWHRAKPAPQELTDAYRKTGFVPELDRHFVGPDNRVYLRSPETEPDQEARDRVVRETSNALHHLGSGVEIVTGIPEDGFKIGKQAAQLAADPAGGAVNAPAAQTPVVDPDRSLARSKRFAREIVGLEGGVANRSAAEDPGGLTRYGVTRDTFDDWLPRHKLDGRLPVPAHSSRSTPRMPFGSFAKSPTTITSSTRSRTIGSRISSWTSLLRQAPKGPIQLCRKPSTR